MSAKSKLLLLLLGALALLAMPWRAQAQDIQPPTYFTGKVAAVKELTTVSSEDELYIQKVSVKRDDSGEEVEVTRGSDVQPLTKQQLLIPGTKVILAEQTIADGSKEIVITDVYRTNTIYWLLGLFILVVVIVGGMRGFASFIGMLISVAVLLWYIVPQILSGSNPMLVSLVGSFIIGAVTVYVAHGISKKSHVSLLSMMAVLMLVWGLSVLAVNAAHLTGLGSEEAYYLQFSNNANINLQGLLLGGIILGALGVLDDITISQASIVFELKEAKKEIDWHELYDRALNIGKDHVASLVNTLVLAYAGANLPLFLLLIINTQSPRWVTINSDIIVEEIIRTLAGSIGLVLAVPLSTFIAATIAVKQTAKVHSKK